MGKDEKTKKTENENYLKNKVHKVLMYSYLFFFVSFLVGLSLDFAFPLKISEKFSAPFLGVVFLVLGTFLIIWAQVSSRKLKKEKENISKKAFCHGPYCFTCSPTHWGLFLLTLGFGISTNALFIVVFTLISFIVNKFVFLKREEKILAEKYGAPYLEYKKSVKF